MIDILLGAASAEEWMALAKMFGFLSLGLICYSVATGEW